MIVEVDQRIIALEVKHSTRPTVAAARQLAWLRDELAERFTHGLVVHTGKDAYPLGDRLWALPLAMLAGTSA